MALRRHHAHLHRWQCAFTPYCTCARTHARTQGPQVRAASASSANAAWQTHEQHASDSLLFFVASRERQRPSQQLHPSRWPPRPSRQVSKRARPCSAVFSPARRRTSDGSAGRARELISGAAVAAVTSVRDQGESSVCRGCLMLQWLLAAPAARAGGGGGGGCAESSFLGLRRGSCVRVTADMIRAEGRGGQQGGRRVRVRRRSLCERPQPGAG